MSVCCLVLQVHQKPDNIWQIIYYQLRWLFIAFSIGQILWLCIVAGTIWAGVKVWNNAKEKQFILIYLNLTLKVFDHFVGLALKGLNRAIFICITENIKFLKDEIHIFSSSFELESSSIAKTETQFIFL